MASTNWTGERAIAGVTSGLIGLGEEVTWEGHHFGLKLQHTSRITAYDRPHYEGAVMRRDGIYRSLRLRGLAVRTRAAEIARE